MKWRIFTPQLVAEDARRSSYVEVEADQMYIGYGGILQFLKRADPILPPINGATWDPAFPAPNAPPVKSAFRKKIVKPKSICIRSFNSGYWADVQLIDQESK